MSLQLSGASQLNETLRVLMLKDPGDLQMKMILRPRGGLCLIKSGCLNSPPLLSPREMLYDEMYVCLINGMWYY